MTEDMKMKSWYSCQPYCHYNHFKRWKPTPVTCACVRMSGLFTSVKWGPQPHQAFMIKTRICFVHMDLVRAVYSAASGLSFCHWHLTNVQTWENPPHCAVAVGSGQREGRGLGRSHACEFWNSRMSVAVAVFGSGEYWLVGVYFFCWLAGTDT